MLRESLFLVFSYLVFFIILFMGAYFFSRSFYKVYCGVGFKNKPINTLMNKFYSWINVKEDEKMNGKKYLIHVLLFSLISFIFGYVILLIQNILFLNPNDQAGVSWDLAFNTMASFVSNTNWQAYSGENTMSYLSSTIVLTVQNFVSGAVGICVLFALIRGITNKENDNIGNFYKDMFLIIFKIMIPVCFVYSLFLVMQGVPQTFIKNIDYVTLEGINQTLYLGPAASQIAIKQIFTNGGGYFGQNSCYPYENPTIFTNLIECGSIIIIPIALVLTFGLALKDKKQGYTILLSMASIFMVCLILVNVFELGNFNGVLNDKSYLSLGNIEGKETRFGVSLSSLWAVITTASSNGSVNSMHDSYTSMGSLPLFFLMMIGEVIFGGVGSGLYGMLGFVLLTVFIAGLMVGRSPEFKGKKINPFDMKMTCLIILPPILMLLIPMAIAFMIPSNSEVLVDSINSNNPAHYFSEVLYAFTSMSANNGSAFAGLNANTIYVNVMGGIIMLVVRFVPIVATLLLADSLSKKKVSVTSVATLTTNNFLFSFLLVFVILVIGALSFFPVLALGPINEFLG